MYRVKSRDHVRSNAINILYTSFDLNKDESLISFLRYTLDIAIGTRK